MNIYLWVNAPAITDNYHEEGSVLAVAATEADARAAIAAAAPPETKYWTLDLGDDLKVWPTTPDAEPTVLVFPDAGCC